MFQQSSQFARQGIAPDRVRACRDFAERAFARAGLPIRWEGKPGLTETGVVAEGELAGKVVVRVNAKYFRPAEVRAHVPGPAASRSVFSGCMRWP